jgi:alpha-glucosidase/alpha-D-xyloside xylohydrolase
MPCGCQLLFCIFVLVTPWAQTFASPIRFAGHDAELVLSEISERTLRVGLFPLDDQGHSRPPTPSTVLVPFPSNEKLRARWLTGAKELRAGRLRVTVKTQPLTVTVRRQNGQLVQELTFDEAGGTNAGVAFHTDAPVLGLGEGAQQFDRRGALYPMEPSWGGWNRPVLGSVVPSPVLIGTDGWALLAHRPEGQFDLREGKGRFIPKQDPEGSASLDLFVINVQEPADALTEYNRLTGRPVMPPKWALGYFQSHRTLAGPEEPLEIARTFREKQLPCDALIYLGTGYCTNGWNTGHGSLEFNRNAFAPENIRSLHDLNFKIVFHVNRAPRNLFGELATQTSSRRREEADPTIASHIRLVTSAATGIHITNYWARHRDIFALGVDGWWPDDGDELPLEAR